MTYQLSVVDDNFVIAKYWNTWLDYCDREKLESVIELYQEYNARHPIRSWVIEFATEEDMLLFVMRWS